MFKRTSYLLAGAALLAACREQPVGLSQSNVSSTIDALAAASVPSEPQRVKWRFKLDGDYSTHSPGVGADGTIYVSLPNGKLFAIAPDGTLRWVFQAGLGFGGFGPVSVGADGTIYVLGLVPDPSGTGRSARRRGSLRRPAEGRSRRSLVRDCRRVAFLLTF